MRQAQDLQQRNNNSSSSTAAGSLGRQRLQSVLLGPQGDSTPAGDSSTSKQPPPHGGSRGAPQRQQQQQQLDEPADVFSSQPSLEHELVGGAQDQQQQQHHPSSRQQQHQRTAGQLVGSNQQQAPTADYVALQQQMAQLQHTLASQQQQQSMQPPQHAGIILPFNGTLPQLAATGCCYLGPPSPSPWPQGPGSPYVHPLGLSSYSPPPMMHPLAAGGWPALFLSSAFCMTAQSMLVHGKILLRCLTPACLQVQHGATCRTVLSPRFHHHTQPTHNQQPQALQQQAQPAALLLSQLVSVRMPPSRLLLPHTCAT